MTVTPPLQIPAEDHLHQGFTVGGSDVPEHRVGHQFTIITSSAQRVPGLDRNVASWMCRTTGVSW